MPFSLSHQATMCLDNRSEIPQYSSLHDEQCRTAVLVTRPDYRCLHRSHTRLSNDTQLAYKPSQTSLCGQGSQSKIKGQGIGDLMRLPVRPLPKAHCQRLQHESYPAGSQNTQPYHRTKQSFLPQGSYVCERPGDAVEEAGGGLGQLRSKGGGGLEQDPVLARRAAQQVAP